MMHGYGVYVWSAYAFTALILLMTVLQSRRLRQRVIKKILRQ